MRPNTQLQAAAVLHLTVRILTLQHNGPGISADMEAAPSLHHTLCPSALLIAAVYRSSLRLSRHTLPQLLTGSAVSLLACGISILLYGAG